MYLQVLHFGFTFLSIETQGIIGLSGEHKVGHSNAATVYEDFNRALVYEHIEVICLAFAQRERRPGTQGEIVDLVH